MSLLLLHLLLIIIWVRWYAFSEGHSGGLVLQLWCLLARYWNPLRVFMNWLSKGRCIMVWLISSKGVSLIVLEIVRVMRRFQMVVARVINNLPWHVCILLLRCDRQVAMTSLTGRTMLVEIMRLLVLMNLIDRLRCHWNVAVSHQLIPVLTWGLELAPCAHDQAVLDRVRVGCGLMRRLLQSLSHVDLRRRRGIRRQLATTHACMLKGRVGIGGKIVSVIVLLGRLLRLPIIMLP